MAADNKVTVYPNHAFYFRTSLSEERMKEINAWLGTLTNDQRSLLEDVLDDVREWRDFHQSLGNDYPRE